MLPPECSTDFGMLPLECSTDCDMPPLENGAGSSGNVPEVKSRECPLQQTMDEVSTKAEKSIVLATAQGTQAGTTTAELMLMCASAAAKRGRPQRPPQLGQCVKLMLTMQWQVLHTHFIGAWREPLPLEGSPHAREARAFH